MTSRNLTQGYNSQLTPPLTTINTPLKRLLYCASNGGPAVIIDTKKQFAQPWGRSWFDPSKTKSGRSWADSFTGELATVNPLSAIWRIYPSSKWSSRWPYDGYIRLGWMTSCGRGRDSATPESFGWGSQGTIFIRISKISLCFPELCSFRRVWVWREMFPALF